MVSICKGFKKKLVFNMFFKLVRLLCFLFIGVVHSAEKTATPTILYSSQSPFGLIEVITTSEPGVLSICENKDYDVMQSSFKQGEPTYLGLLYAPLVTISFCFAEKLNKVLLLGLGAGDFLGYLMNYFPTAQVDAVEINPAMIDIVKKFREMDMKNLANYHCRDGFEYVDEIENHYDLIFCDMYLVKPSIAKKYTDLFKKLKNCLNEGGVFIFNAYIPFVPRAVVKDIFENFENIAAAGTDDGGNIVFICYQGPTKTKENFEKTTNDMQAKYGFRYALPDILQKFEFIPPTDYETWITKFSILS